MSSARRSTNCSEAILRLRAVRANDDFVEYWRFHLNRERHRVHESRYANGVVPQAA
jgi:hypothetical protein